MLFKGQLQFVGQGVPPKIIRVGIARLAQLRRACVAALRLTCFHLALLSEFLSLTPLQSLLKAGFDKIVKPAVQYRLSVTGFNAGTQILYATLVEYIITNLAAPADIGLAIFDDRRLGSALCISSSYSFAFS